MHLFRGRSELGAEVVKENFVCIHNFRHAWLPAWRYDVHDEIAVRCLS